MNYLSLFSGIEAATQAWHPLGWKCVGVSEIEPFPCAVLAHHYPTVPNLGDVTKITEEDIKALGHIDIVVFGSPCQDLSVAGLRKGFTCESTDTLTRSGLFFVAMRIIAWARQHCGCRFALWENVPGAFSSSKGRDFATVVEHMAGLENLPVPPNGWGTEGVAAGSEGLVEWAVLDAQWFGVAQRRRRVFALADFGNWAGRQPILLEPESMRGDSAPSRKTREEVAAPTRDCAASSGAVKKWPAEVSCCLDTHFGDKQGLEDQHINQGEPMFVPVVVHGTQDPCVSDIAFAQGRNNGGENVVCFDWKMGEKARSIAMSEEQSPTLGTQADRYAVAYSTKLHNSPCVDRGMDIVVSMRESGAGFWMEDQVTGTLDANMGSSGHANRAATFIQPGSQVRRLTPIECARLQGFPDLYLDITFRGKPAADGNKYKALGNSMAVPVMAWIGKQINEAIK